MADRHPSHVMDINLDAFEQGREDDDPRENDALMCGQCFMCTCHDDYKFLERECVPKLPPIIERIKNS